MLLFGAEFLPVANVLIVLVIGTSIFAIFGISSSALVVSGHQKLNLVNAFTATIINITLNIILIPKYGILGASLATLTSMTFIAIARIIETRILLLIHPFSIEIIKSIIAGLITYGLLQIIKPYLMDFHTIITLIFAVITISAIYGILMFLFKFDEDDKDFLVSINFLKNKVLDTRK
jgi:O-antigen/teichoic acid export membrane protein